MHMITNLLKKKLNTTLFPYTTLFRSPLRIKALLARTVHVNHAAATQLGMRRHAAHVGLMVPTAHAFGVSGLDRKSTRLNSSHVANSYAVFCLKKKRNKTITRSEEHTS